MSKLALSVISSLLLVFPVQATGDSISLEVTAQDSLTSAHCLCNTTSQGSSLIKRTVLSTVPMIMTALPYAVSNRYVRDQRNSYLSSFHNRYDDYLQFAPLAMQLGLHTFGAHGHSTSTGQLLTADALATAIMMTSVTLTKNLTRVVRPDGSSANSFPSGHTAMAFLSATALHLEYGQRYPLVSLAGYLMATGVGVGRMMNNRHWIGDVMVGAGVGIASAELGYWLSGLLYKRRYIYKEPPCYFPNTDLRIYIPWSMGIRLGVHGRAMGLGLRWSYDGRYFVAAEGMLEGHYIYDSEGKKIFARSQRVHLAWGRDFSLRVSPFSLDASLGLGLSTRGEVFPSVQLRPRLRLTPRLGWTVTAAYEYRPQRHLLYSDQEVHSYHAPQWRIGSALELRL